MERNQITKDRGRPNKIIKKTLKKDLEINELDRNIILNKS